MMPLDALALAACIAGPLLAGLIGALLAALVFIAIMIAFFPKDLEELLSDAAASHPPDLLDTMEE